jgi:hypothetical protein
MSERKNYNLSLSIETYNHLQKIAEQEGTTLAEMLRKAIKWLLFIRTIKMDPDARLLVKQDGEIKEIITDLI